MNESAMPMPGMNGQTPPTGGDGGIPPGMEGIAESAADLLADDPPLIEPGSLLLADDQEILGVATSRITRSVAFRSSFESKWTKAWQDWMLYLRGDSASWKSDVKVPLVYSQVSSAIPNFVAAIYDSGKLFDVEGDDEASERNARVVQDLIEFYLRAKSPSERQAADWCFYAILFGTGVMRSSWLRREGTLREIEPVQLPVPDGMIHGQTRIANRPGTLLDNRPILSCVDLWNWYPAPCLDDEYDPPWAFERVESTIDRMIADAKAGMFGRDGVDRVGQWLETTPETQTPTDSAWLGANSRASAWGTTGISNPWGTGQVGNESADRLHTHVFYWLMAARDYRIVIAGNGGQILGRMPNPHKHGRLPYTSHWFQRIPKSPFGRGVGEVLEAIQRQVDFNYNKGNDAAQLALNKPIKLRAAGNAGVTKVWQPGIIVRLRATEDMEALEIKNPMGEVEQMNAGLQAQADRATGLNDLARGQGMPGVNTATEAAAVSSQFRMRMNGHARELRVSMSRLGELVLSDIQQFIDGPQAIKVAGKEAVDWKGGTGGSWETVQPEQLAGTFRIRSTVSFSKSNPTMIRQDLLAAAPIVSADPMVNHREWLLEFFKGFGFEHPERLVIQPPPPLRNPVREQEALDLGFDVDPSPDEVTTGAIDSHLAVHLGRLQALTQDAVNNGAAIQATRRHVEKTMQMEAMMSAQAQQEGAAPPGSGGTGKKPDGGSPERKESTRLGKAQGSNGPPGRAPGPSETPGREPPRGAMAMATERNIEGSGS